MKKNITAFASVLFAFTLNAQLVVNQAVDPGDAVNNFLLGEGVAVSNAIYSGDTAQIATFSGFTWDGIAEGIILSTGNTGELVPTNMGNLINPVYGDDDLLAVANSVPPLIGQSFEVSYIYDVASLEFDFVPLGPEIAFNFQFASEEYNSYENTQYNDAFAFFISGPGIEGSYSNGAVNIATVPGSDPVLPITISSVNSFINADYYDDNLDNIFTVHGFTEVFTAAIGDLVAGQTYHIRLVIGNGSDEALNSYVFLEAGSFTSSIPATDYEAIDFDDDGIIGANDLIILMGDYGCTGTCIADANADGEVNVADIILFINAFGNTVN